MGWRCCGVCACRHEAVLASLPGAARAGFRCGFPLMDHPKWLGGGEGAWGGVGWQWGDWGGSGAASTWGVFGCMGAQPGQAAPERGVGVRLPLKAAALSMYIEYVLRKEREPGADGAIPNPYSWKWARSFISGCWGTLQARSGPLALHVPEVIQ